MSLSPRCYWLREESADRRSPLPLRHPTSPSIRRALAAALLATAIPAGGQVGNNDSADDIAALDLTKIHYLSGPIAVEGAEPGDALLVEILDVQPLDAEPWGYSE